MKQKNEKSYISSMEFYLLQYGYKIKMMREKGMSEGQIAKALNVPKPIVKAYLLGGDQNVIQHQR